MTRWGSAPGPGREPEGPDEGPPPVDKPRWLLTFASMTARQRATLVRQRCDRQRLLWGRPRWSGLILWVTPLVMADWLLSPRHRLFGSGAEPVSAVWVAVSMGGLFAFLAAAACEIIDRVCGPQRARR